MRLAPDALKDSRTDVRLGRCWWNRIMILWMEPVICPDNGSAALFCDWR